MSRKVDFYYGHPQNRFWGIMARLFDEPPFQSFEEKTAFLHRRHIALWDVLNSCEIRGAEDASIRKAVPNDLSRILDTARINAVFTNGKTAGTYYQRYFKNIPIPWIGLPSTSPANCRNWTNDTLFEAWKAVPAYL